MKIKRTIKSKIKRSAAKKASSGQKPKQAHSAAVSAQSNRKSAVSSRKTATSRKRPWQRSKKARKQVAPRTAAQYFAKSEKFKEDWERVITVISKMRAEKISLRQASRDAGISSRKVLRLAGPALQKRATGKWVAKKKDNLLREMKIPTSAGTRVIAMRGSQQATLLGEYWNAVHRYLQTGDASRLERFRGKSIKDANGVEVPLPTDHALLNRLASAGVLSFEDLYGRSL